MPEQKEETSGAVQTDTQEAVTQHLSPDHYTMLTTESAITSALIAARGYKTVKTKAKLRELGFCQRQQNVPSLLIPLFGPDSEIRSYQVRPD